jgi:hypothetical protein
MSNAADTGGVLVVTDGADDVANAVVAELRGRGVRVVWVDPSGPTAPQLAACLTSAGVGGWIRAVDPEGGPAVEVTIAEIGSAWYQAPARPFGAPRRPRRTTRQVGGWSTVEALWAALPGHLWLNRPVDVARAGHRTVQLRHAAQAGLAVPATMATTSTTAATAFLRQHGPLRDGPLTWPPHGFAGRVNDPAQLERFTELRLLQADTQVTGRVRITVVDRHVAAVRAEVSVEGRTPPPWARVEVAEQPHRSVLALMDALALRVAVLDLLEARDGSWVFVGLDATPREAWDQALAGENVAVWIADALTHGPRPVGRVDPS